MDKSLKKLNRLELLQLLLKASEANEALIAENDALRKESESQSRLPRSAKVGSIAEAALQANGYFEAAQKSADDYLREIKRLRDQMAAHAAGQSQSQGMQASWQSAQTGTLPSGMPAYQPDERTVRRQAQIYLQDAQSRAADIVNKANQQAQAIVMDARARSEAAIANANQQANGIVDQANRRADAILNSARAQASRMGQVSPTVQTAQYGSDFTQTGRIAQRAQVAYSVPVDSEVYAVRGRHARLDSGLR